MKKLVRVAGLLSFVSILAVGCEGSEDAPSVVQLDFASGDAAAGQTTFAQTCAPCHGADAKGTGAGPNITGEVNELAEDELAGIIKNGYENMPAQNLSDQQVVDVIAWLEQSFGQ